MSIAREHYYFDLRLHGLHFLLFYTDAAINASVTSGVWLGATFLDPNYVFDGNRGLVKDFQMKDSYYKIDYFVQVTFICQSI